MATGYTAILQERHDLPFREFALRCARGMGACIMQRDDDMDQPPTIDEPSTYHAEASETAKARLFDVERWTMEDAWLDLQRELRSTIKADDEYRQKAAKTEQSYQRMLSLVEAWTPPTPDHDGLKKFMTQQIEDSIRHDCDSMDLYATSIRSLKAQTPAEWKASCLAHAREDLAYHTKHQAEEIERANGRNEWKRQLFESL